MKMWMQFNSSNAKTMNANNSSIYVDINTIQTISIHVPKL